jgi:hypothetical protein
MFTVAAIMFPKKSVLLLFPKVTVPMAMTLILNELLPQVTLFGISTLPFTISVKDEDEAVTESLLERVMLEGQS